MSELVSPYVDTELYSRVRLSPLQLNNDLYIHLKNNLKKKVEKKCCKNGYITKIYKILKYSNGIIIPENFDAAATLNVKYSCRLCRPVENTMIICKIDVMNKVLIKASNGPIFVIIKLNQINDKNFIINNKGELTYNKNNHILNENDYLKVKILATTFYANDERIITLANLEDIATDKEVKEFYKENLDGEKIENIDEEAFNSSENERNSDFNNKNSNYVNV